MIRTIKAYLKSVFVRREFVSLNRRIEIRYTPQAQMMIEQLKDFDRDQFEKEFISNIVIGDAAIWKYVLQREINTKNGGC
jgi:DNA-binding MarR family transcriptional regulator